MQAEKEYEKEMGFTVKKRTPARKAGGSSKGGHVNKKTRASFDLSNASMKDSNSSTGYSTNAAREL